MKILCRASSVLAALLCSASPFGCGDAGTSAVADREASLHRARCTSDAQCPPSEPCADGSCEASSPLAAPKADPPPAQCHRRHPGATAIEAVVRIERYKGLIRGRNGTHEIAFGTIISTPWVFDPGLVDSARVQLAMNVASSADPVGLPRELPLLAGESIRVEGEYIPAAQAHVRGARQPTAVIHYTHSPCGFVVIKDHKYR